MTNIYSFSEREAQVANLLLEGKSNKEIALQLGISVRTVEFHVTHILAKAGVSSRAEAIVKLSGTDLRIPAGETGTGDQRESTVEKADPSVHNYLDQTSNRRSSMKKWLAILLVALIALFVFLCLFSLVWNYSVTGSSSPHLGSPIVVETQMPVSSPVPFQ